MADAVPGALDFESMPRCRLAIFAWIAGQEIPEHP
jgi:hypothetical protein